MNRHNVSDLSKSLRTGRRRLITSGVIFARLLGSEAETDVPSKLCSSIRPVEVARLRSMDGSL